MRSVSNLARCAFCSVSPCSPLDWHFSARRCIARAAAAPLPGAVLIALVAGVGAAIAARHVWITAQPPGTVAECGASLDYMLEVLPVTEVLSKVLTGSGECGQIDWRFLGLSMPAWVLIWLLTLAAWGLTVNLRRRGLR